MIPLHLSVSGFLSYRDTIEVDFSTFDLACISGANGAGKSSLLDAITWALFGQARRRDDSLINTQSEAAEVQFTFQYEGNTYRVQRTIPRGKTSLLEFQLQQNGKSASGNGAENVTWKPLTERTLRDTQARIAQVLRLDYDTFVNASFFLQGKADLFTQQRPGDRKRILSSILGLEIWEVYRQRAVERRKSAEMEIATLDARLADIHQELAEEAARKTRLKELQAQLDQLSKARQAQEAALEKVRQIAATLAQQSKLVETLGRQLEAAARQVAQVEARLAERRQERIAFQEMLARAEKIEASYQAWQQARADVTRWDEIAAQFQEQEKRRLEPLQEVNAVRARLEQERDHLLQEQAASAQYAAEQVELAARLEEQQERIAQAEAQLAQRAELDARLQEALQEQAAIRSENPRLREEMLAIKARIERLKSLEEATCPLCGQPLSAADRTRLIDELTQQGGQMGDQFRANEVLLASAGQHIGEFREQIAGLKQAEMDHRQHTRNAEGLRARLDQVCQAQKTWEQNGAPRLEEVAGLLSDETFAAQARQQLATVDAELKAIGYDAATHDAIRQTEVTLRQSEAELRGLENARAALVPLEREISDLEGQLAELEGAHAQQQAEYDQAAVALAAAQAEAPDLMAAESALLETQEQENRLRLEVGAARQKVLVLDDLKERRTALEAQRETHANRIAQYKQLERAFGKDGVPALLIEQALPQIEIKANDILERLSGGQMSVRFITQAAYKDKRRDDLRETLDIQISDGAGRRDYEMFSGGEAFRVNFAIRLALSEILAQRAGARLQTLVIDEGFGSQDALGRQRLIEAINLVRGEFAKILVITHIDELKDAFPTRIEVEKTERGSVVQVV